jgi:hypothetical protein
MEQSILISGKDTLLLAFPLLLMVFISAFRLDRFVAAPKGSKKRFRPACGVDETGEEIICDPDGRRISPRRRTVTKN